MSTEERSEFAEKCKNIGNRGFQVQDLVGFFLGLGEGLVTGVDKVQMKKRWMMDLEKSMLKQVIFFKGAPNSECFVFPLY